MVEIFLKRSEEETLPAFLVRGIAPYKQGWREGRGLSLPRRGTLPPKAKNYKKYEKKKLRSVGEVL
ncbi:hypothetical protein [Methanosarcina siciliae]|uniref:hypothetical protein n=1 Tax=Methanosarcina siciliae TaxID=38027 RepID=UPI00064FAB06|nr:hypothetical protein [Methanosarcina siciliae]